MLYRVEVKLFPHIDDAIGHKATKTIRQALPFPLLSTKITKVYTLEGFKQSDAELLIKKCAFHDPILQEASLTSFPTTAHWIIEVSFRPGVTDNEGRTARDTAAIVLGVKNKNNLAVYTAAQYRLYGDLTQSQVAIIANNVLANDLIQRFEIKHREDWRQKPGFTPKAARVTGGSIDAVETIRLSTMSDKEMFALSQQRTLALSLEELRAIRKQFLTPDVKSYRKELDLTEDPTDVELEMLAQTWSEHCKHKIFAAKIFYEDLEEKKQETIDSLYKTYIQETTKTIRGQLGENDFCRSVFKDNAGVVAFNKDYDVCVKVETHNSPSALDPYGGALTGIIGVNRDPMGTGIGAELVCNTDVFCFASPFYNQPLPPRILHPRRIFEGVREGVEHGGNKSGVPTVNGSVVFDERFLGKPLVYCGTVGILPAVIHNKKGYEKKAAVGDYVVMVGGRIGKDGIHGATFSSEELHEDSPATAVQIGDPITQRKMYDFIIQARNQGLYSSITDNGAGGLSSSVGEMAQDANGCVIDLALAPLKYDGLRPWEILLSEAQERMTLAVPKEHIQPFAELAKKMDVEVAVLGEFSDTGYFHATYGKKTVAYIDMNFLHHGLPQLELKARWEKPSHKDTRIETLGVDHKGLLKKMLGRLNVCSKEYLVRQYDHEVLGGSVVKPMMGLKGDAPMDAGAIRPLLDSEEGLIVSHGICPKFSDYDAYWMAANAIDESIRNAVAVGADPDRLAGVDNFCWCDPVQSEKTPDGSYKLAQLVRACQALATFCLRYGVPCVSGKDSMKNDYIGGGIKISIPPTLLFSVLGVIPDVTKTVTSDFKKAGDSIYIVGTTARELAGSEIAGELSIACASVPIVHAAQAKSNYRKIYQAVRQRLLTSCHDLSDGGFAVALAEMCIGGRLGCSINFDKLPTSEELFPIESLYSESASRLLLTVDKNNVDRFEELMGNAATYLGDVSKDKTLSITSSNFTLKADVEELAQAFKATLDW